MFKNNPRKKKYFPNEIHDVIISYIKLNFSLSENQSLVIKKKKTRAKNNSWIIFENMDRTNHRPKNFHQIDMKALCKFNFSSLTELKLEPSVFLDECQFESDPRCKLSQLASST